MADQIVVRPQARFDIVEFATTIGKDSLQAAERFMDACESTFEMIGRSPGIGGSYASKRHANRDLRVFPVRGFRNHLVFYRQTERGTDIVRVLHGASELDAALTAD